MIKNRTSGVLLAMVVALFTLTGARAQEEENRVLVRVNGAEIRISDVRLAAENIIDHLSKIAPNQRYIFTVQYLIERHLLAQEAVKNKIEENDGYKQLLAYYKAKAARDAYFATAILPQITDQMVRAEYDKQAAAVDNKERTHLRSIQVEDEAKAKEIHAALVGGADFAKLADENTPEGVAKSGGDFGWFAEDEMLPAVAKAASGLKVGDVSAPFETNLGWTIIKVEERKTSKARPFEEIKDGLAALLARRKVQEVVAGLSKDAKIEVLDPDLQKLQIDQTQE